MAETLSRFHWADYLVTAACLLVSLGIGVFFAFFHGGQKTKEEYLVGSRKMSLIPVCLSMFVTFQSAISLIGAPSDVYNTGTMVLYYYLGMAVSYVIGYYTVVPLIYPLRVTSVYEYFGIRFQSNAVRLLATITSMLQTVVYMAIALFSPALALQAAAGLALWVSVVIVGIVGTVYTAIGGIKSVVWTDVFQTVIIFIGLTTVLIKGITYAGGMASVADIAQQGGRIILDDVSPDPRGRHTLWSCFIGMSIMWLASCFNQSSVQRISALKTLKDAKRSYLLNIPLNLLYGGILILTGLVLYAYVVASGCDPYEAKIIGNLNQMMPYFVVRVLTDLPGMAGLYMSMLFSGALSTFSSGINSLAANTVEDILPRCVGTWKDSTVTIVAKIFVFVYGFGSIGLAYILKTLQGPVTQMSVNAFGACGGPVLGMFFLGGVFPKGNKYGAFGGGVIGLLISIWITVGSQMYGAPIKHLTRGPTYNCQVNQSAFSAVMSPYYNVSPSNHGAFSSDFILNSTVSTTTMTDMGWSEPFSIYDISYLWCGPIGVIVTFVCGLIISLVTRSCGPDSVDPALLFPFIRRILRMPEPEVGDDGLEKYVTMKHYDRVPTETPKPADLETNSCKKSKPVQC